MESDEKLPGTSGTPSGGSDFPFNVRADDCSVADDGRIRFAVAWLQDNVPLITAKMMESTHLMSWPGNSRENFEQKLNRDLKFVCISQKDKCEDLWGIVYPVVAQGRINLCSAQIRQAAGSDPVKLDALFIHVVAHEIGHLVRLNAHKNDCEERYTDPGFSYAVGLAAEYAFLDEPYDPSRYTAGCRPPPFDWTRKVENMEKPLQSQK
jgi:hypothetical protein